MKNEIAIQVRTYPVTIRDQRTGEQREDLLTLDKAAPGGAAGRPEQ